MYDVIVVGARCAGSPLAMLLAREGAKVLLVDRATFPQDIPHGHFIHRAGPRYLREWGLLDRVLERTPGITTLLTDFGDFPLLSTNVEEDGLPWGIGPRRSTLDEILAQAAVAAGAEARFGFSVDGYLFDEGRVVGIRGHGPDRGTVEERATLVVGADGRNSRLARAVEAPVYNNVPPLLCYYFSYWSGVEAQPFELYVRGHQRRVIFSFRTQDDLYAVFIGMPVGELANARGDIRAAFAETLVAAPSLAERLEAGRREERFYGASDLPNFYRRPFGPGWALVGDAGLHKDPWLALGIGDAFRDADLLATAISDGLSGRLRMEESLARFEERRNEASGLDYQENIARAQFAPPPLELLAIRAAVRHDEQEATRYAKAMMRLTDPAAFFNPEHVAGLLRAGEVTARPPAS